MILSGWMGLAASVGLTLGLLGLCFALLQRIQRRASGPEDGIPLCVLRRINVGPKQAIAVVRVADRTLVVSIADGGTSLLTELDDLPSGENKVDEGLMQRAAKRTPFGTALWRRIFLTGVGGMILLGLSIGVSRSAGPGDSISPSSPTSISMLQAGAPAAASESTNSLFGNAGLPQIKVEVGEGEDGIRLTGTVGLVVLIGVLTLLPALLLLMTSFTRILIVLQFIRPALGTQTSPPTQILAALAVLMTGVVMHPVLQEANDTALQPYLKGEMNQEEAFRAGLDPFREFMLANTREKDLGMFVDLAGIEMVESVDDLPTTTLVSAFVTSELRTAFQMGFVIFLPFVVLDVIIASVLVSLGMFMLPPMMVSLPFKLLLFVLADGWTLVTQNVVSSFRF